MAATVPKLNSFQSWISYVGLAALVFSFRCGLYQHVSILKLLPPKISDERESPIMRTRDLSVTFSSLHAYSKMSTCGFWQLASSDVMIASNVLFSTDLPILENCSSL